MVRAFFPLLCLSALANAHTAAWTPGMYCFGGNDPSVDRDTNTAVNPLFNMTKKDWWFQHYSGCDLAPPKPGKFLNLTANGTFTVEFAHHRCSTTFQTQGSCGLTDWPDGKQHPENWSGNITAQDPEGCIQDDGALHTHNQSTAAGTAFAISYNSNITNVTMENLVVFSVLEHTPWKRLATYQVPDLPACPPGGCTCAWLWIPTGCGTPNMYMAGYKCQVLGATNKRKLGTAKAPTYCKNNPSLCVKGPKQMIAWHQQEGDNVVVPGANFPGYNSWNGFSNGAQNDIFV